MGRTGRRERTGVAGVVAAAITLVAAALLAAPVPAAAVGDEGIVIETGVDDVDRQALISAVHDARMDGVDLSVAVLAGSPADGIDAYGQRLAEESGGVVLVVTPTEANAVSAVHDDAAVSAALDAATPQLGGERDIVAGVTAFAAELADAETTEAVETDADEPLLTMGVRALIVGGIVVLAIGYGLWRKYRSGGRRPPGSGPRSESDSGSGSRSGAGAIYTIQNTRDR